MDKINKSKKAGKFIISTNKEVYGELTLDGANTLLYLHDHLRKARPLNESYRAVDGER